MQGKVKSNKGFYVGDVCYVLGDAVYYGVWGKQGYKEGVIKDDNSGLEFAVAGTRWGDGEYQDYQGGYYPVDAGVIGLVPMELVAEERGLENGRVFFGAGEAEMSAEGGLFWFGMQNGHQFEIDTRE